MKSISMLWCGLPARRMSCFDNEENITFEGLENCRIATDCHLKA